MELSRKKATTIALDPEDDRLLSRAAPGSRRLAVGVHQTAPSSGASPKPRSASIVRALTERGYERELVSAGR